MKVKCANCGREFELIELEQNEVELEGFCTTCTECEITFNIDFNPLNTFICDVPKMADFKILTKEEFLDSYSYLTEEEYDATKLYLEWLTRKRPNDVLS